MAALTAPRRTREREGTFRQPPVKAATRIWQGSMVAIDATGYAVPAATATTLKIIGRAEDTVDNSAGGNGDLRVKVTRGIFCWGNSAAGDAIALADIGATAYAVDDQTVAKTDGSAARSAAGRIYDVDADGVWVEHL